MGRFILMLALAFSLSASTVAAKPMGVLAVCYTTSDKAIGIALAGGECSGSENPRIHAQLGVDLGKMLGSIISTALGLPGDGISLVTGLPGQIMGAITGIFTGDDEAPAEGGSGG